MHMVYPLMGLPREDEDRKESYMVTYTYKRVGQRTSQPRTRAAARASHKQEADAAEVGRSAAAITLCLLPDQAPLPNVYARLLGAFDRTDEALVNGRHTYTNRLRARVKLSYLASGYWAITVPSAPPTFGLPDHEIELVHYKVKCDAMRPESIPRSAAWTVWSARSHTLQNLRSAETWRLDVSTDLSVLDGADPGATLAGRMLESAAAGRMLELFQSDGPFMKTTTTAAPKFLSLAAFVSPLEVFPQFENTVAYLFGLFIGDYYQASLIVNARPSYVHGQHAKCSLWWDGVDSWRIGHVQLCGQRRSSLRLISDAASPTQTSNPWLITSSVHTTKPFEQPWKQVDVRCTSRDEAMAAAEAEEHAKLLAGSSKTVVLEDKTPRSNPSRFRLGLYERRETGLLHGRYTYELRGDRNQVLYFDGLGNPEPLDST